MNEHPKIKSTSTLKSIILFLLVIFLINPFILFIVLDNIWLSMAIPSFSVFIILFLYNHKSLKVVSIYLLNIFFIASLFLYAEAIFIHNFRDYIIEDLYAIKDKYYFNHPNLNQIFRDKEFVVHYKTNKQGFRIGYEDDPEIEVNEVDWLFIGDSYTQGAQVQYEDLYTNKLYKYFPSKTIVNAGISGFGLPDEYNYYLNEGRQLKPKKVFLQICNFNDFMNVCERQYGFSDYLMQYSNFARYLLYGFKYANPAELPLGRWTEPFYPDEKLNKDYNIFYKAYSKKKEQDIINFERYLKKLNDKVKEDGAELIVIQIPTKEQVYYKYLEEVVNGFHIDISDLDMNRPNTLVDRICKENAISHIDLLQHFSSEEKNLFYEFDEHLNTYGHQRMADYINSYLKPDASYPEPDLISTNNSDDRYPNFSITNNRITFQSFRDGNMELFVGDSLLNIIDRLTWNNVNEIHPWPSPDGSLIVFTEGNQEHNDTKVVLMGTDGSQREYITKEENIFGAIPAFNHDASKIIYAEWQGSTTTNAMSNPYIAIYNTATMQKEIITSDEYENWRPIFSPDDKTIFYISKKQNNQFDIYSYDLTNHTEKNLTNTAYDEWDPAVSPDGRYLAYSAKVNDNWDLFLIDLKTQKSKQITSSIANEWDPVFSPKGNHIYYAGTFGLRNGIYRIKIPHQ